MEGPGTIHIVPEESLLMELKTKFPCTVEGCDRSLPNYGALRMHIVKTHKLYQSEDDRALAMKLKKVNSPNYAYHCPVQGCPKSRHQGDTTGAAFTSMKLLKQHYGKLHAEKKFRCVKCDRGFGLERDKRRHEETCGLLLKCQSCGCPYSTVEAMLTHCRRKGHIQPIECNAKKKTKEKTSKSQATKAVAQQSPVPPNIFVINVMPPPTKCPTLLNADGFRHILPKPIIQQTVPMTTVTMATDRILVDQRDLLLMQNVNTQTEFHRVEQGTCMTDETFQLSAISTAVQTNSMEDNGHNETGRDSFPGDQIVNDTGTRLGIMPYFQCSLHEKLTTSNSHNIVVNASTQHTGRYKPKNRPHSTSSMTQHSYLSQVVDKNSPNVSSLKDTMCLTKGMQTLMSLPLRSELSIALAGTQTSGDFILKQAMTSADITLNRQSKGSQVSPRSKVRGERSHVYVNSQSCQTSQFSEHKTQRLKKGRKLANKYCAVNSVINKPKQQRSGRCTARINRGQVSTWCNTCQCIDPCTCVRRQQTAPIQLTTDLPRIPHLSKGQRKFLNSDLHINNPCSKHQFEISQQADMLIDGPQEDGLQSVSGTVVDFDDFTDHQTQTVGLLEEFNSVAATISTQTAQSYLAQPSTASTETEAPNTGTQHSHTQTFVSAFSLPSDRALQVQDDTAKLPGRPYNTVGSCQTGDPGDSQVFDTTATSTGVPYNYLESGNSGVLRVSQDYTDTGKHQNVPVLGTSHEHTDMLLLSGQLYDSTSEASNALSCRSTLVPQRPSITFTNSNVQTASTDLLNLLDTGIQADSGPGTTIQTQTDMDEMWELFCHNMETQTADDILQELGFSDIQIQTNMDLEYLEDNSSTVETQTMWHALSTACGANVEQSDMQTQTLFPTTNRSTALTFDTDLTDSHTQTPWVDITALILDDL